MTQLGDMSVAELLESALREIKGLSAHLDKPAEEQRDVVKRAYLGSIMARLSVAEMKLGESP